MEPPRKGTFEHTYFKSMSDNGKMVVEKEKERAQDAGAAALMQCWRRKEKSEKWE